MSMQSDGDVEEGGSTEQSCPDEAIPPHTPKKRRSAPANLLVQTFPDPIESPKRSNDSNPAIQNTNYVQIQNSQPLLLMNPHLARLFQGNLNVPGTSVPSEKIFSTAGDPISAQRCALTSEHIDQRLFLKKSIFAVVHFSSHKAHKKKAMHYPPGEHNDCYLFIHLNPQDVQRNVNAHFNVCISQLQCFFMHFNVSVFNKFITFAFHVYFFLIESHIL